MQCTDTDTAVASNYYVKKLKIATATIHWDLRNFKLLAEGCESWQMIFLASIVFIWARHNNSKTLTFNSGCKDGQWLKDKRKIHTYYIHCMSLLQYQRLSRVWQKSTRMMETGRPTGDDDPNSAWCRSSEVDGGTRVVARVQFISVANSEQTVSRSDATLFRHQLTIRTFPSAANKQTTNDNRVEWIVRWRHCKPSTGEDAISDPWTTV